MNASPTNISGLNQSPSVRRWLLAFFAPTYLFVGYLVVAASFREVLVPGGTLVVLLGISVSVGLWFCLREVVRVQRPVWQKGLLAAATVAALAVQTIVDTLFFGLLSMELWGFPGPS